MTSMNKNNYEIYYIEDKSCIFPKECGEYLSFACFGQLKQLMTDNALNTLSFAQTEWIDVSGLLYLGVLVGNCLRGDLKITIDLGNYTKNPSNKHDSFIVFFVNEGFFDFFQSLHISKLAIKLNGVEVDSETIKIQVDKHSSGVKKCFQPVCQSINDIFNVGLTSSAPGENHGFKSKNLMDYVEQRIRDIETTVPFSSFGGSIAKESTLQKIRPILQELIQNIYEHAYIEESGEYFAIFARLVTSQADKEHALRVQEEKSIPSINQLARDHDCPRIELFILDGGIGLRNYAEKMSKKGNILKGVVEFLGGCLLKGVDKADRQNKDYIAGLQHIGNILADEKDYMRLYTEDGMLSGCCNTLDKSSMIQAKTSTYGRGQGNELTRYIDKLIRLKIIDGKVYGTYYYISIAIHNEKVHFQSPWYMPSAEIKKELFHSLAKIHIDTDESDKTSQLSDKYIFCEQFFTGDTSQGDFVSPTLITSLGLQDPDNKNKVLLIRLAQRVSKDTIIRWLEEITRDKFSFQSVLFVDVSPSFAKQLLAIALSKNIPLEKIIVLRIITITWNTISLFSPYGSDCFYSDPQGSGYTAKDFYISNSHGFSKAFEVIHYLIKNDSVLFWKNIDEESFHNGEVLVNMETTVSGYLHFKEALANKTCRAICKLALKRILHLLPIKKIEAFEPLVYSLVQELSLAHREYFDNENGKIIALVSVNASASSFHQHAEEFHKKPDYRIACFQAPSNNISADRFMIFIALNWLPNIEAIEKIDKKFKRIPKTAYIMNEDENISLPYQTNSNSNEVIYCSKNNTYQEMLNLNCLLFQHTNDGGRHDLLSLNTARAIENAVFQMEGIYRWLLNELSPSKHEEDLLIVYPSHYANDIIINLVLNQKIDRLSISFFSVQSDMPLRIAPNSATNLEKKCQNPRNIIIFDDGVITKRHLSCIRDFILYKCLIPHEKIKTVSLVDRTRSPIDFEIVKQKNNYNKRYWRHDIPVFSNEHSCIFCNALEKLYEIALIAPNDIGEIVTSSWIPLWKVRDIYAEWGSAGLTPIIFDPPIEKSVIWEENVYIKSSTLLLAYIIEIAQLLPGTQCGIEEGKVFLANNQPEVTIELVTGQFLLLFYDLSPKTKEESANLLFEALKNLLYKNKERNFAEKHNKEYLDRYVSLSTLCFLLLDKHELATFWEKVQAHIRSHKERWVYHETILYSILYHCVGKNKDFTGSKAHFEDLAVAGMVNTLQYALRELFGIIGVRPGENHSKELTKWIEPLEKAVQKKTICLGIIKRILVALENYAEKLTALQKYYDVGLMEIPELLARFDDSKKRLNTILEKITFSCNSNQLLSCYKSSCQNNTYQIDEELASLCKELYSFYRQSVLKIYSNCIFRLNKEDKTYEFIHNIAYEYFKKSNTYDSSNTFLPKISSFQSDEAWESDYYIVTPDLIRSLVINTLSNTQHRKGDIRGKFDNEDYAFILDAKIEERNSIKYCAISISNKTDQKPNTIISEDEKNCLELNHGIYEQNYNEVDNIYTVTILLKVVDA